MAHDVNGVPTGMKYSVNAPDQFGFSAELKVEGNKLKAIKLPEWKDESAGQRVMAAPGEVCDNLRLEQPVDFYLSEHAANPTPARGHFLPNQQGWVADPNPAELWMEVTVPPKGPPRPLQLALKENGVWMPLAFQ